MSSSVEVADEAIVDSVCSKLEDTLDDIILYGKLELGSFDIILSIADDLYCEGVLSKAEIPVIRKRFAESFRLALAKH